MTLTDLTVADRHRTVAAGFSALAAGVGDWDAAAPVADWAARDVVRHFTDWLPGMLGGGSSVELTPGPDVDRDPVGAWEHLRAEVQRVLDEPELAATPYHSDFIGTKPVSDVIDQFYTSDVFMHSWDLARASGQQIDLDPEYAAELLRGLQAQDEDTLRGSGQFGPPQPVSEDAPVVDRLAAFIGRDPGWAPPGAGS